MSQEQGIIVLAIGSNPIANTIKSGRASLMNLIEAIIAVPDHRQARGIRHPLWLILTIILLGSCTGYWGINPWLISPKITEQLS